MPNPVAAKRLIDLGCKVKYEKSNVVEPRKIRGPDDIRPGTKKGKLDRNPIWIVEIQMPKKVAFDIYRGYMDKMKNENGEADIEPAAPAAAAAAPAVAAPTNGLAGAPAGAPAAGTAPAPTV
jgi:hypothetical protein